MYVSNNVFINEKRLMYISNHVNQNVVALFTYHLLRLRILFRLFFYFESGLGSLWVVTRRVNTGRPNKLRIIPKYVKPAPPPLSHTYSKCSTFL